MTHVSLKGKARRRVLGVTCLLALFLTSPIALAQHAGHMMPEAGSAEGMHTPTVAFDSSARLWRVWVDGKRILVSSSRDEGRTYAPPIEVTKTPEPIDANGESRPKIAVGPAGEVFVTWTRDGARAYTGDIRFSRSTDGGRTFTAPVTVNDDGLQTGHRFDALAVAPDGTVYVVWIDKRDLEGATAAGEAYDGAALYYAVSRDKGATFEPNRKIKDHICECCRIAHAFDADGRLVVFWRDVMTGSIRDHAMVRLTPNGPTGPVQRVTADNWAIDACPHHGPWLAMGPGDEMHITWFTGEGKLGPGTFYGRLSPSGVLAGTPVRLGEAKPTTGHAVVAVQGTHVFVVWKESRRPGGAAVMLMASTDGGKSFDAPRELARTDGLSDHPFLVGHGTTMYLSWWSADEGHRIMKVAG